MPRIERPPVGPNVRTVAALLDLFLGAIVTRLTQRLQPPQHEFVAIAVVRLNVVADCRWLTMPRSAQNAHSGCVSS